MEKIVYEMNNQNIPFNPKECLVTSFEYTNEYIKLSFANTLSLYDSVKEYRPKAKGLTITVYLTNEEISIYTWKIGVFKSTFTLEQNSHSFFPNGKVSLKFSNIFVGDNMVILELLDNTCHRLECEAKKIEYDWE